MTREEILAMEAGRELNKLVAEKVMNSHKPDYVPQHSLELFLAGSPVHYGYWTCVHEYGKGDEGEWIPDPFSTDISAAWPVARKMGLVVFPLNNGDWACCKAGYLYHLEITQDHYADPNLVICKEAPEAISKMALIISILGQTN